MAHTAYNRRQSSKVNSKTSDNSLECCKYNYKHAEKKNKHQVEKLAL